MFHVSNPHVRCRDGAVLLSAFGARPAVAQLNTAHLKGTVGLKAGSQPPPHWYVVLPAVYVYAPTRSKIAKVARSRSTPIFRASSTSQVW